MGSFMGDKAKTRDSQRVPALVILDRDGVINHDSPHYIKSADEWHPIPGSLEAIAQLTKAGIQVAIATNQRGISLGLYGHKELHEMHEKLERLLHPLGGKIAQIEFCIADDENHPDRKPNPGMLKRLKQNLLSTPSDLVYFVGDKYSDLEAAIGADSIPILVRTGNGKKTEKELKGTPFQEIDVFNDLAHFVAELLSYSKTI